ncbi:hypothetical protein AB9F41_34715, partial [Rhizobium leguminosarum]|uniref:hypothetical protein n=1 Tax=Rhizobium leguminosarum TaxID=384 RepID=UPI003F980675
GGRFIGGEQPPAARNHLHCNVFQSFSHFVLSSTLLDSHKISQILHVDRPWKKDSFRGILLRG